MTTANRATWTAAKGGHSIRDYGAQSRQFSSRDIASHTKIKFRQPGQGGEADAEEELSEAELRRQLEERELDATSGGDRKRLRMGEDGASSAAAVVSGRGRLLPVASAPLDADEDDEEEEEEEEDADGEDDGSDEDDSDDEDDTEELMRELEKIKRERAEEAAREEAEKAREAEEIRKETMLAGNPLLAGAAAADGFKVAGRWDDDVVFKNQARGVAEEKQVRFINDSLRSDFHRKFMDRFCR